MTLRLSAREIVETVAIAHGLTGESLKGSRRSRRFAYPRFIAATLIRDLLEYSLPEIGKVLRRDHTSIMYAIRRTEELVHTNGDFAERYRWLREQLAPRAEIPPREGAPRL